MKFKPVPFAEQQLLAQPFAAEHVTDNEVADGIRAIPAHFADLSITTTSVAEGTGARKTTGTAGEAITIGQSLYYNSTDSKWYKADANATGKDAVAGIALSTAAAAGQPVVVQTEGQITIGATVAIGTIYVQSATAGGICPSTDLVTGMKTAIIGIAVTAAIIDLEFNAGGVAVP